jgi:hypothetical protein
MCGVVGFGERASDTNRKVVATLDTGHKLEPCRETPVYKETIKLG